MSSKDEKPKREGALKRFVRETVAELRRVSWPTWPEARRLTWIVIVVVIVMAIFLGTIDFVGAQVVRFLVGAM
ncbi:MAG: preprotein translocase subunit SecE [Anaerolineales bacterium]|nr:preprotein translocase subunit SecE [Anaerolineales bacterium]